MLHTRMGRVAAALAAAGGLSAAGLVAFTGTAGADYGAGATYQIEISANSHLAHGTGAGIWLWFSLTPTATTATGLSGSADYVGADCQNHLVPTTPGSTSDSGSVIYHKTTTANTIVFTPIPLASGVLQPTIVVPDTYGHEMYTRWTTVFTQTFLVTFLLGTMPVQTVQVTVAP